MPPRAQSALVRADDPVRVAREVAEIAGRIERPAGCLIFASGALGARTAALGAELAARRPGLPALIGAGAGVLTERGELEGQAAAAVLVWTGGRVEPFCVSGVGADEAGEALGRAISDRTGRTAPGVFVLMAPDGMGQEALEPLREGRGSRFLFGAGTAAGAPVVAVDAEARVSEGGAAALILRGLSPPVLRVSPACRLLTPLRPITETRGSMIVSIDSEPALDVLSAAARELSEQPLVLVVLAEEPAPGEQARPELMVRGVQGVDPVRRALVVSEEVRPGMRIAFAVRDPSAARADLEAAARDAERALAGAAPRFGVYVNCAGRGSSLYGAPDVDTRILRARFRDLPLVGLQSSFEIGPHAARPALQLYTGVLALFTVPS
jgi:small ligand-binding sensory domain FIST